MTTIRPLSLLPIVSPVSRHGAYVLLFGSAMGTEFKAIAHENAAMSPHLLIAPVPHASFGTAQRF